MCRNDSALFFVRFKNYVTLETKLNTNISENRGMTSKSTPRNTVAFCTICVLSDTLSLVAKVAAPVSTAF